MTSQTYEELNKAWKSTCRVLLGEEVGELRDFEPWLAEFFGPPRVEKSAVSGKDVFLPIDDYCKDAKFISFDEVKYDSKFQPLDINEIKDIDSIVESLQERFYYTGNCVLGNSKFVENSSNIGDSHFIYNSALIDESQYVAYTKWYRYGKNIFGVNNGSASEHCIKGHLPTKSQRCFDVYVAGFSSDIYYSAAVLNCSDCMFSFNLRGKRRCIGNLELSPDKYIALKKKLISEIAGELKSRKRVPSLFELISGFERQPIGIEPQQEEMFDIAPVEKAFRETYKLILKREPEKMKSYESFLSKVGPRTETLSSTSSPGDIVVPSLSILERIPVNRSRLISMKDSLVLGEKGLAITEAEAERLSFSDISPLSRIAYAYFDVTGGKNHNIGKSVYYLDSSDCYAGFGYREAKLSAYSFWPRESSYMFGCSMALSSSFCINAYYSKKMTRSFEVDNCDGCSDLLFGHNCENVRDSMFCFNSKNMNYAIGNAPLPPQQYASIKNAVVEQLADELDSRKGLKWGIYNIGCGRKQ